MMEKKIDVGDKVRVDGHIISTGYDYSANKFYIECEFGGIPTVESGESEDHMSFRHAWFAMLNGKHVKRPTWSGYWAFENNTIVMHTRDGEKIDIRETENIAYTFSNIVENDWMVVED